MAVFAHADERAARMRRKHRAARLFPAVALVAGLAAPANGQGRADRVLADMVAAWNTGEAGIVARLLATRVVFHDAAERSTLHGPDAVQAHLARRWQARGHRPIACVPTDRFDLFDAVIAACRPVHAEPDGPQAPPDLWLVVVAVPGEAERRIDVLQIWPHPPPR